MLKDLRMRVNEYITLYNSERYQWALKKMTSDESEVNSSLLKTKGEVFSQCPIKGVHCISHLF
ncbi:hypothetical protein M5X11_05655 [Paenibacillus alginolyticus]|nr:hypothetical protein [Paenibacillus alginolyticus]